MAELVCYYLATMVVFLALDICWLKGPAAKLYARVLGPILLEKPRLGIAFGFYLLYGVGIVAFAIMQGVRGEGVLDAMLWGALLGLIAYATYDLVNLATLKHMTALVAVVDISWGIIVTAVSAAGGYWLGTLLIQNILG